MRKLIRLFRQVLNSLWLRRNCVSKNVLLANKPRVSRGKSVWLEGTNVYIGFDCHIGCDLRLGSDIMVASRVAFVGGDHSVDDLSSSMMSLGRSDQPPITIEDDVWVGHGAIVLAGTSLGRGCVVGAGAVVTRDVAPYSIVGGNPARVIRMRGKANQ